MRVPTRARPPPSLRPAHTPRPLPIPCRRPSPPSALADAAAGVALFLTPGALAAAYALYLGKGNLSDGASRLLTNVSQGYFQPDVGGANIPVATGELSDLAGDEPLFKALYGWFIESGGVYKLAFGPKAFVIVSDPVVVRHLLRDNAFNYGKGVLAEILEPIMGKGLIPADLETWKPRRRAIVPAFHAAYINAMVKMFGECAAQCAASLDASIDAASGGGVTTNAPVLDMEERCLSYGLDVIGRGVFNFDFGSTDTESPVIRAVYGVLKEAEHRSTFYIPYWNLPLADVLVPRQRAFRADLAVINATLDDLINRARATRSEDDAEALAARNYDNVSNPSILQFLVDARGADLGDTQLRDDLMTMLIAGHETTAAVLTWALFSLVQDDRVRAKAVAEIDAVCADGHAPTLADVESLPYIRACIAESLRMYPQPPILIRRSLTADTLPPGLNGAEGGYPIGPGADLFISVWNLHRSPHLWREPDMYRPERFEERFENPGFNGAWAGFDPARAASAQYPNEVASDFAFIPFGGGARKCVGDQFALLEAVVLLGVLLRRYDFELPAGPGAVGMATGATIHTANGLKMRVTRRSGAPPANAAVPVGKVAVPTRAV